MRVSHADAAPACAMPMHERGKLHAQLLSTRNAHATPRQASFDYAATEPGELTFTKGDYITVIAEDPSGWWQGRNERTGQTGVFPSNYTSPA